LGLALAEDIHDFGVLYQMPARRLKVITVLGGDGLCLDHMLPEEGLILFPQQKPRSFGFAGVDVARQNTLTEIGLYCVVSDPVAQTGEDQVQGCKPLLSVYDVVAAVTLLLDSDQGADEVLTVPCFVSLPDVIQELLHILLFPGVGALVGRDLIADLLRQDVRDRSFFGFHGCTVLKVIR